MTEQTILPRQANARNKFSLVLRSPAFVVLWLSEALSLIGDRLIMVALVTLVYDRTGSASAVGLLMLLKAIPALALGSLAGVFVDRWNRKWIMVIANLLQGLLVFWLPLSPGIVFIFAIYLAMSMVNQFFIPARSAAIPDLVAPEALLTANSLFAISMVAAMAIGPAIGTWITERVSLNAAFYADAATFLIPAMAVAFLVIPRQRCVETKPSLGSDLRAGLAFARSQPAVLAALATISATFLVIGTISVAGVVITREILHVESSKFGIMMSAMGIGMLGGAIASGWLGRRFTHVKLGVAGVILMALGMIALPWSSTLVMASIFTVMIGMGMIIVQVNGQTLLQTIAPEMRGRLMGFSQTLTGSVTFLASALVGLLIDRLNVTIVMSSFGILTMAVAVTVAIYYHKTLK
ncbi:MAG: MFS transporter [Chloroflexi bacterium]|nr:MFS transporter [Chloroflexota bacterium]